MKGLAIDAFDLAAAADVRSLELLHAIEIIARGPIGQPHPVRAAALGCIAVLAAAASEDPPRLVDPRDNSGR